MCLCFATTAPTHNRHTTHFFFLVQSLVSANSVDNLAMHFLSFSFVFFFSLVLCRSILFHFCVLYDSYKLLRNNSKNGSDNQHNSDDVNMQTTNTKQKNSINTKQTSNFARKMLLVELVN